MRVLLITGVYPPDIGGPAKYISELAEFLVNSGIKTEVITLKNNITKTKKNNWPVFSVKRKQLLLIRYIKVTLLVIWKSRGNCVILANGLYEEVGLALFINKKPGIVKLVSDPVWERAIRIEKTKLSREAYNYTVLKGKQDIIRKFFRWGLSQFKVITCPSSEVLELVNSWKIDKPIIKIENGIEYINEYFSEKKYDVIAVSRLIKSKNIDKLIQACQLSSCNLLVIGSGPEEKTLKELVSAQKAEVKFLGQLSNDEILNHMKLSKIFAQLSDYEGLSFSLLHAMACGLPVLVSNVRGNTDVVSSGIDGLVVETNDIKIISNAISSLLNSQCLMEKLGSSAKDKVRKHYSQIEKFSQIKSLLINLGS
jgi:glycosyltransferase involved in cell wall biosynthesis